MMNNFWISILFVLLATVIANNQILSLSIDKTSNTKALRFENNNKGLGNGYSYVYELNNGQIVSEKGTLRVINQVPVIIARGAYTYTGPDNVIYWVNWTADQNGFHAEIGTGGVGGIKPGQEAGINPSALKSLVG